ncbi:YajG family lipoprotein [Azospirillum sp. A1-3]|uniref:YajG family lipoprotein n=1 Tax=Azospirillum sp. A1-3 TaxID=185874 RepID=UPI002076EE7A|nr:YajG family lipoprotein [Azospirillum sp. A1-3]MCM8736423.1 YajG family lipoprotein [Azospirillum sp. A1-3]
MIETLQDKNKMIRVIVCALLAALVSGCALTEDSIAVKYSAPSNISVVQGAQDVTISVTAADGRVSNRDRVSTKKNGYGMEMAKITASNDVVAEVSQAVQAELASLGFNIGPGGIAITVQTTNFYNDFKPGFWSAEAVAEVAFDLTAKRQDGTLVYSRSYRAVGVNKDVMLMMGEQAVPALSAALRDAVQLVVQDTNLHQALLQAGTKPKVSALPTS